MADGIPLPATGVTAATDDCGAPGHVQIVKLAISTDGSATLITADANGLEVQGPGTAGTAAGGVMSVQGVASMTPVQVGDNSGSLTVDNGGTFAVQVDGAALTALQLIDDTVFADDGAFTVGTSKVTVAGFLAVAHGSTPDTADALDAGAPIANRHRIPFMLGGHPNLQSSEYFTSGAITDDNILPAIAGGTIYVITGITVTCSNANVTSPSVRIGFGTANVPSQGTTNADAVAKMVLSHPGIAPGSGIVKGYSGGIVGIGGDGEELRITCTTPTTSMIVQVDWFTIAS